MDRKAVGCALLGALIVLACSLGALFLSLLWVEVAG